MTFAADTAADTQSSDSYLSCEDGRPGRTTTRQHSAVSQRQLDIRRCHGATTGLTSDRVPHVPQTR